MRLLEQAGLGGESSNGTLQQLGTRINGKDVATFGDYGKAVPRRFQDVTSTPKLLSL